jgi:hypothetical protein
MRLVFWSTLAITFLAVVMIIGAIVVTFSEGGDKKAVMETSRTLLSTLLPLFGTWVGTVLAFYFTKENFEVASRTTMELVKTASGVLDTLKVAEKMIPRWRISGVVVPAGKAIGDLTGEVIAAGFESTVDQKPISRLPFFDEKGAALGILHRSIWMEMRVAGSALATPYAPTEPFSKLVTLPNPATSGKTYGDVITGSFVFVPPTASLAEAKRAMEALLGCQDVFVTADGKPDQPVVGWLPNVDIARASRA